MGFFEVLVIIFTLLMSCVGVAFGMILGYNACEKKWLERWG